MSSQPMRPLPGTVELCGFRISPSVHRDLEVEVGEHHIERLEGRGPDRARSRSHRRDPRPRRSRPDFSDRLLVLGPRRTLGGHSRR